MDAEKLPQVAAASTLGSEQIGAEGGCAVPCEALTCRSSCSLEVIDGLLSLPAGVSPEEADALLDFRQLVKRRRDAEGVLRLFCDLRRRMEQRHYLAFYRLRRWLENHIVATVRPAPALAALVAPLRLGFYCVEAVRRGCLCHCLNDGATLVAPRLEFVFMPANRDADPVSAGPHVQEVV